MQELDLEALIVTHLPNIRYLTGFTGSTAMALISPVDVGFMTDSRYVVQAGQETGNPVVMVEESYPQTLGSLIRAGGMDRVGFESGHVNHQQLVDMLRQVNSDTRLVPTSGLVESLRQVKEPGEVDTIRRAVELASDVYEDFVEEIRPGLRERDVAVELEYQLHRRGAEKMSFETIVASGSRSALPHGLASDNRIGQGFLVIDFGIVLDGYCSDMTRTIHVGQPDASARRVYETVLAAQLNCEERMRAGMSNQSIDALTRDVIESAGYGQYYGHGTGHGVGLEVHEAPRLSRKANGAVPVGAVVTVEPGVYLPGWGGVRIEDVVVVTDTGCDVLTRTPKEMMVF